MSGQAKVRRDALGKFCFYLHLVILGFITLGWTIPSRGVLIFHLVFLPVTVLHWRLNGGNCVLNNLENWLRFRRWRVGAANPEEGAWLRTLIGSITGIAFSRVQMDLIIYCAMALFWALGWLHLLQFQGS
jgi:hypothetical protein